MSYVRVWVVESSISWSEIMKLFRKQAEPGLKALKKAGLLSSYKVVQTGPHTGLNILEFDSKAKMNKVIKAMNSARGNIVAGGTSQTWVHTGKVKASG